MINQMKKKGVPQGRFELPTYRSSADRSPRLSYCGNEEKIGLKALLTVYQSKPVECSAFP